MNLNVRTSININESKSISNNVTCSTFMSARPLILMCSMCFSQTTSARHAMHDNTKYVESHVACLFFCSSCTTCLELGSQCEVGWWCSSGRGTPTNKPTRSSGHTGDREYLGLCSTSWFPMRTSIAKQDSQQLSGSSRLFD